MSHFDELIRYFEKFPGIGGRQARRFAFHILHLPPEQVQELADLMQKIRTTVSTCPSCRQFFSQPANSHAELCTICANPNRDHDQIMIVSHDSDIQAIERSGLYHGLYFVLGGTAPLLSSTDNTKLRTAALKATIEHRISHQGLTEIVLAFAVNPDGENTARYITSILEPLITTATPAPRISQLGRGLSTGSELEYADPETIRNALKNRQ